MRVDRRRVLLGGVGLAGGLAGALAAGPARAAAVAEPYRLPRAQEWQVTAGNGRRYRVLLSWPAGEVPERGWPVLYALDGNAMFEVLTGACRFLADEQQGVVVAIDFPLDDTEEARRDYEYTLPAGEAPGRHGGAEALLAMVEDELKPAVEQAFHIDRARQALFGHSYGGLFALHALFTHTAGFSTYLAASPSIWWGGGVLLREAEGFARQPLPAGPPPRLQMTFGEWEGRPRPGFPAPPPAAPGLPPRRVMGDNVRELATRLGSLAGRLSALEVQEFPAETHGSVRAAAAGRAVPFAFAG